MTSYKNFEKRKRCTTKRDTDNKWSTTLTVVDDRLKTWTQEKGFKPLWFKTFYVRRNTKTQKHKGVLFEQFESVWA